MKRIFRRLFNPLMAFIGIQLAWIIIVVYWISWFLKSNRKLRALAEKYSPELLQNRIDWVVMVEGLVLLIAILVGVYVIFVYWKRQSALAREQRNFMSQISHEFKSPLASLQLHLETIRMRQLSPEQMDAFFDTMLADTARLRNMVDNLLTTHRLEQKKIGLDLKTEDFSLLVETFLSRQRPGLPPGSRMTTDIESGLYARIDSETLTMALRNLLENAVLYSDTPPEITVTLRAEGNWCHFSITDRGRGIAERDRKKIFRMFYRVRKSDENIRGSGLGLFIVRAVVWRHRGKVWLESAGLGKGSTFHILLPKQDSPEESGE
ncbi:MAG: HAMP domain-containing sensor histidine kinase [Syntrophotaleaceae bacterium]